MGKEVNEQSSTLKQSGNHLVVS